MMVDVYTTLLGYSARPRAGVLESDRRKWAVADAAGVRGALIFTSAHNFDPFVVAQRMLESTERLVPLVAVQPPFTHPFHVARQVSTLLYHYERQIDLNLITGGDPRYLRMVGNDLGHDDRYQRLIEFGQVLQQLVHGRGPANFRGTHYEVRDAVVQPPLPERLVPRMYVAGSSPACGVAAKALGVTQLMYPREVAYYEEDPAAKALLPGNGVRLGILARDNSAAAWAAAERRFPPAPRVEAVLLRSRARHQDSDWTAALMNDTRPDTPYWLGPFRSGREYCPFLVGSHAEVGEYLSHYLRLGVTTLILHATQEDDDVPNAVVAVDDAARRGAGPATNFGAGPVTGARAGSPE